MTPKHTLIALILLTMSTAGLAMFFVDSRWVAVPIMVLSSVKFLLVAFDFMELRKAHIFWKSVIVAYIFLFNAIVLGALTLPA